MTLLENCQDFLLLFLDHSCLPSVSKEKKIIKVHKSTFLSFSIWKGYFRLWSFTVLSLLCFTGSLLMNFSAIRPSEQRTRRAGELLIHLFFFQMKLNREVSLWLCTFNAFRFVIAFLLSHCSLNSYFELFILFWCDHITIFPHAMVFNLVSLCLCLFMSFWYSL